MDSIEQVAGVIKAFSDPTRLRIIKLLNDHRCLCVNAITQRLNVTQSAVSQHLRVLRQTGLVNSERKASRVHYSLDRLALKQFNTEIGELLGDDFLNK